ncbi:MAG: sigma-70 family RNA polymerase sigma factor [Thermoanaerobaculia bacterium]
MSALNAIADEPCATASLEQIYVRYYDLLCGIAVRRFNVPAGDAESLAHDVFLSYMSSAHLVADVRSWLVGAICNASRRYRRTRNRSDSLPEGFDAVDNESFALADRIAARFTVSKALERLQEKCRETLRLRFVEGCTAPEVATDLDTTNRYAEKLLHKCLKRIQEIYFSLDEVTR